MRGNKFRLATARLEDAQAIQRLMKRAIEDLQIGFLDPKQIAASHRVMGLDTQLIEDGTYFCVWAGMRLAGCGGWSYRETLYGGDHSAGRDAAPLDPVTEKARIRAMYTHPDFVRQGVGQIILSASEEAARQAGFRQAEMAATLAGEPFYTKCGYRIVRRWNDKSGEVDLPLLTMTKSL